MVFVFGAGKLSKKCVSVSVSVHALLFVIPRVGVHECVKTDRLLSAVYNALGYECFSVLQQIYLDSSVPPVFEWEVRKTRNRTPGGGGGGRGEVEG